MEIGKWIAVGEALPECKNKTDILFDEDEDPTRYLLESDQVLIYVHTRKNGKGYVDYGHFDEDGEWLEGDLGDLIPSEDSNKIVTHWMPMPTPPSDEEITKQLKLNSNSKNQKTNESKEEPIEKTVE
jgi:hypothetical protein